jgi:hypothetical protein
MPKVNYEITPLASAARTATTSSPTLLNRRHTGVLVILNVTAASGTGGLTTKVQARDPISGNWIDLVADAAAILATGTYAFEVNPSAGAASGGVRAAVARHLPQEWRITVAHGDASSYTYSVSATLMV